MLTDCRNAWIVASRREKNQKPVAAAKGASPPSKAIAKTDPKTTGLQKRLATAQQKLEQAKASGATTKNLEDRIYEIEDAIRLSSQAS